MLWVLISTSNEALLMSTHNIYFLREITKMQFSGKKIQGNKCSLKVSNPPGRPVVAATKKNILFHDAYSRRWSICHVLQY